MKLVGHKQRELAVLEVIAIHLPRSALCNLYSELTYFSIIDRHPWFMLAIGSV
jgi:hypothetical protein